MALHILHDGFSGMCGIGSDPVTGERGFLIRMVNGDLGATVKGTLVAANAGTDNAFQTESSEFDAIGVVAQSGVAAGGKCWVWVNGSICQVLWKDGQTSTRGYVALCADTDGRGYNVAVPTSNPVVGEHFKEIGHVLETKGSGTDVLVLCSIHFN